jgi:hypothetical protein
MLVKKNFLTIAALAISLFAVSQSLPHSCGHDHWMTQILQADPARAEFIRAEHREWVRAADNESGRNRSTVYQVPVVFHIVWNTPDQNLPDSVIFSQIEVLNEDFRRLNLDAALTRDVFLPIAADAGIEFYLATEDPQGNPTSGIVRVQTDQTGWSLNLFSQVNTLDYVKMSSQGGSDAWDTDKYLNIWVCNILPGLFGQVFGLAYPPNGAPNWPANSAEPSPEVSGVLVHYTTVGRNNPVADQDGVSENDYGRTCTHEIGHYFGLRHIWGDGFFNGCNADDGIADTPNCSAADNYQCNLNANTCVDSPVNFPDMIENFMDYSIESCQNIFTQGQVDLMRWVLENLRPGLIPGQVAVKEQFTSESIRLYPNPACDFLRIQSEVSLKAVEIRDGSGRVLESSSDFGKNAVMDVSALSPGIYFLAAETFEGKVVRTFVKF